jgi:Na+-translocating ferredoxin:NAD+ oxidoreductase RnfC subunit
MELSKQLIKDAGIVGAGGAGFPSYAKISEGADLIVINGAECEPLLYTDYFILEHELSKFIDGAEAIIDIAGVKKAILVIKSHTGKRLSLEDGAKLSERISVRVLGDIYPTGDEIALIYEATGRLVKPGKLPISEGVIVYNVETVYNISRAANEGFPVIEKWLTVGGDVHESVVVRVPVGTRVSDLFEKLGIRVTEEQTVLDGGPSMGKIINYRTATVKKNTKSLLVLPNSIEAVRTKKLNVNTVLARSATACCQCTRCTDMCPRYLLGYPLEPHKMIRSALNAAKLDPKIVINATLCCNCGICESLACPQGISAREVISSFKGVLAKNKLKYVADSAEVRIERDYRKVSSDRWKRAIGVSRFDKVPTRVMKIDFPRVEISLSQHIGAPSVPVVTSGERVTKGSLIARSGDGLSVPLHASIDGVVTVQQDKITIEKVN